MTVVPLFPKKGRPLVARERAFLRDLERWSETLKDMVFEFDAAVVSGDVRQGVRVCRQLERLGYHLGEAGREMERS